MKKYLLLVEDEEIWQSFKEIIEKDLNTEIMDLIRQRVEGVQQESPTRSSSQKLSQTKGGKK